MSPSSQADPGPSSPANRGGLALLPWVLVGVLAVVCGALAVQLSVVRQLNERLREQQKLTQLTAKLAETQLEAERLIGARQVERLTKSPATRDESRGMDRFEALTLAPTGSAPDNAIGALWWDQESAHGLLVVSGLGAEETEALFQLWVVADEAVNAGTLTVKHGRGAFVVKTQRPVNNVREFRVTRLVEGRLDHSGEVVLKSSAR